MTLQQPPILEGSSGGGPLVVSLLRADPDLAPGIAPERRREAQRFSAARVWSGGGPRLEREPTKPGESGFGLLVLSGVLCRRTAQSGHVSAELIGPGDLIRPWESSAGWSSLPVACRWVIVKPAQLAILDRAFAERVAPFPEIAIGLSRRSVRRTARLATALSGLCQPRVESRLTTLFWQLADRFGKTRADCIHVPVPLTHGLLAELVAMRRPSVTKALARLRQEGVLERAEGGWLLRGPGPTAALSGPWSEPAPS
jgi:hypothetical protein